MHSIAIGCLRLLLGTVLGQGLHGLAPAIEVVTAFAAEVGLLMLMVLLLLLQMCSGGHLLLMLLLLLLLGRCKRSNHVGRCTASDTTTTASRGSLLGVVALLLGLVVV